MGFIFLLSFGHGQDSSVSNKSNWFLPTLGDCIMKGCPMHEAPIIWVGFCIQLSIWKYLGYFHDVNLSDPGWSGATKPIRLQKLVIYVQWLIFK